MSAKDYLITFGIPEGRRVLKDLKKSYDDRISFNEENQYLTAFQEGQRSVYKRIMSKMKMAKDPQLLKQIEGDLDE